MRAGSTETRISPFTAPGLRRGATPAQHALAAKPPASTVRHLYPERINIESANNFLAHFADDPIDELVDRSAALGGRHSLQVVDGDFHRYDYRWGPASFHIFAALAEHERNRLIERTHAGLIAARGRGRIGGRPASVTDAQLRQTQKTRADGMSIVEEAKILRVGRMSLTRAFHRATEETIKT